MTTRLWKQLPGLGILALVAAFSGPDAKANLTLNISNAGSASNQSLLITNGSSTGTGTGTFDFTGNANATYTSIVIDGQTKTIHTNGSGHATGTFNTLNVNSVSFSDSAFGEFNIGSLTATRAQSSQDSYVDDVNTDVSRNANTQNRTLTISTGTSFTQPSTPTVVLQSSVHLATGDPNATVSLDSKIAGPPVNATATHANPTPSAYVHTIPGSNPYNVTSTFTVSNLGDGSASPISATIEARTDVYAAPEPATLVMGAIAFPLVALGARLRRNKKQS